jgi:hypothetical protein
MCSTLWQWTRHSGPDVTKEENIQKTLQPGIQEPQFSRSDFGQVANPLELCFPINQHLDLEWPFRTPRIPSELPEERWFQHTSTPKISISKLKFIFYLLPYCWLACSWCNLFRLSHAERFGTEFAWITVHKIKLSGFHCTRRTCVQTRQEAAGFSRLFQTPVRIASPLIQHSPVFIVHCYNSLPPKAESKALEQFLPQIILYSCPGSLSSQENWHWFSLFYQSRQISDPPPIQSSHKFLLSVIWSHLEVGTGLRLSVLRPYKLGQALSNNLRLNNAGGCCRAGNGILDTFWVRRSQTQGKWHREGLWGIWEGGWVCESDFNLDHCPHSSPSIPLTARTAIIRVHHVP